MRGPPSAECLDLLRNPFMAPKTMPCHSGWVALQVYLRYGRAQLDTQLEAVFGTSDLNSGKTLSLTDFLAHLHANQVWNMLKISPVPCKPVAGIENRHFEAVSACLGHCVQHADVTASGCPVVVTVHTALCVQVAQLRSRVTAKTYEPPPLPSSKGPRATS